MGFLKKLGAFGGTLVGGAIGGTISVGGQVVGSEFIEEIGEGVFKSTVATGKILGETASGAFDVVDGIITSNKSKIDEGFEDIGGAAMKTVKGIGNGIGNTIKSSPAQLFIFFEAAILTTLEADLDCHQSNLSRLSNCHL